MDEVQKKLVKLVSDYPNCLDNKTMLRGFLADLLNEYPLENHLINNAYETGIIERLTEADDYYLCVLSIQKQLESEYGLTEQASLWTIGTWSYMLGILEAAGIAEKRLANIGNDDTSNQNTERKINPLSEKEKSQRQQVITEIKSKRKNLIIKCIIPLALGVILCPLYPFLFLVPIISVFILAGNLKKLSEEQKKAEGKIKFPRYSKLKKYKDIHAIADSLRALGFVDIDVDNKEDLKIGLFKKPGMLDTILINGTKCKNKWYDPDDHIVIVHHGYE